MDSASKILPFQSGTNVLRTERMEDRRKKHEGYGPLKFEYLFIRAQKLGVIIPIGPRLGFPWVSALALALGERRAGGELGEQRPLTEYTLGLEGILCSATNPNGSTASIACACEHDGYKHAHYFPGIAVWRVVFAIYTS